jgi:hypothetical protein
MPRLRVRVRAEELRAEDRGSVVRAVLRDTSMADALHPTVAEATRLVPQDLDQLEMVLDVPEGVLDPRHRYSLWVHVDHKGGGQPQAGDLITTQNVPVAPEDLDDRIIDVPLTRI